MRLIYKESIAYGYTIHTVVVEWGTQEHWDEKAQCLVTEEIVYIKEFQHLAKFYWSESV